MYDICKHPLPVDTYYQRDIDFGILNWCIKVLPMVKPKWPHAERKVNPQPTIEELELWI